jgi:hypothetical protein
MGSRPNFFPVLDLPDSTKFPGRGPKAGGPVADGEKLIWAYVWIIQNGEARGGETWAAAAYAESPGAYRASKQWEKGTEKDHVWRLETEMAHDSDAFRANTAALATAMALVDRGEGERDVYWWTEAVKLKAPPKPPSG